VHQDFIVKTGIKAKQFISGTSYLKDGSAIEELVKWEIPLDATALASGTIIGTGEASSARCVLRKSTRTRATGSFGEVVTTYSPLADATGDLETFNEMIENGEFTQLPVHRGILFGAEALVKLVMEGVSDSPKIIIKALGSSGVADPIDQRQSIGFKVDGFGLAIKRPEAVVVTFGIPKHAELAALSNQVVFAPYQPSFLADAENDANLSHIDAKGAQTLRVDGVNLGGKAGSPNVAGFNDYKKFSTGTAYLTGTIVLYNNEAFIFAEDKAAGAWDATKVKRYVDTLERNVFEDSVDNQEISVQGNSKKSNVK
jgi:hypothetical protein